MKNMGRLISIRCYDIPPPQFEVNTRPVIENALVFLSTKGMRCTITLQLLRIWTATFLY